jgi:RNA polymerase sigma factor (sigma-70 family)
MNVEDHTSGSAPLQDHTLLALFHRARGGDDLALQTLCRHMRPRLFRAALSIMHDADDADDVAQEALVRAVTRRFLFLGKGSVGGWMTRIALNLAKNRRRDEHRRREIVADAPAASWSDRGALAAPPIEPHAQVEHAQERARLRAAMEQLSSRQRAVVVLRAEAGLDFADVASALDITEENARVTFAQAKKKLLALVHHPKATDAP